MDDRRTTSGTTQRTHGGLVGGPYDVPHDVTHGDHHGPHGGPHGKLPVPAGQASERPASAPSQALSRYVPTMQACNTGDTLGHCPRPRPTPSHSLGPYKSPGPVNERDTITWMSAGEMTTESMHTVTTT